MPRRFQNVRQNFAAGEVTPRLSLRIDHGQYENACSDTQNFIVTPQGTAIFREGWQYIGRPPSESAFRLFQYHRGGDESDLLLEISPGLIRYWVDDRDDNIPYLYEDNTTFLIDEDDDFYLVDEDDGFYLTLGVVADEVPYTESELDSLYFTNQDKYGVLCHTNHPPYFITLEKNGQIFAEPFPVERIPLFAYQDTKNPAYSAGAADWRITFPAAWADQYFTYFVTYNGVQARYATTNIGITYSFDPATPGFNNETNIEAGLTAAAVAQGFSTTFSVVNTVGDTSGLVYDVTVSGDNAAWPVDVRLALSGFNRYEDYAFWNPSGANLSDFRRPLVQPVSETSDAAEEVAWSYPTVVTNDPGSGVDHYYRALVVHTAAAATNEPGVGTEWERYWEDLGIGAPEGFAYQYPAGNAWADTQVYAPADRGFPTVAVFNEQRLILMANKDNPTALYGSGIGAYFNYKAGPNDDEPFLFVLDSSDTPQIKWARSQRNLTLGTSSGEWIVTASVTITPTDISARQQNNARSRLALPVQIDTEIFYIEQGGKRIRVTRYFDEANSLISQDASLLSEHLIANPGVKRIAASFIPSVLMTLVRDDGQVVYFTYEKSQPVLAFTKQLTDGFVNDVASYFALPSQADWTYYAVERNGRWSLERMRYPRGEYVYDLTNAGIVHMDSWVTGAVDGDLITGLDHLEGQIVWALVDDAWQFTVDGQGEVVPFVVTAGQITLPENEDGKTYAVGLPLNGRLRTFEMVDNDQGTGLGTKRRWNRLYTRILNSSRPQIYTERASDRFPATVMGEPETIIEGLFDIDQSTLGFGDGSITIDHDRPYPLQILGFYGEYQVEDR